MKDVLKTDEHPQTFNLSLEDSIHLIQLEITFDFEFKGIFCSDLFRRRNNLDNILNGAEDFLEDL